MSNWMKTFMGEQVAAPYITTMQNLLGSILFTLVEMCIRDRFLKVKWYFSFPLHKNGRKHVHIRSSVLFLSSAR